VDVTDETELEIRARAHAHYAAGVIHDLNEEPDLALQEYYKAAANDPDDESLILEISRRLILAKQPEKALDLLREAAVRPEASGAIFARLGLVCLQLDRNAEALEAGRTAVKRSPLLLAGYHTLFKVYLLNNRDEEALNTTRRAGGRIQTRSSSWVSPSFMRPTWFSFPANATLCSRKCSPSWNEPQSCHRTQPCSR
jgi:tetratricopeptide (TPR) repeat protein